MIRLSGLFLRDKVTSEKLNKELLLFQIKRNQLSWLWHLVRMHPGHLPGEVSQACLTWRRPDERGKTHWRDYRTVSNIRNSGCFNRYFLVCPFLTTLGRGDRGVFVAISGTNRVPALEYVLGNSLVESQ